jgi:hypothetical protein
MKKRSVGQKVRLAIPALLLGIASAATTGAHAYATFFGEDANNSATVPLGSTPKADAAQATFLAGLSNVRTETFESQNTGAAAPLTLKFTGADGTDSLEASLLGGGGTVTAVTPGTAVAGRYSVPSPSTSKFWQVEAGGATGDFTITFNRAIAAFGFYGIDIGDFGGQLQLELLNGSTSIELLTVPNGVGDGSVLFFGLLAQSPGELFTSIRFLTTTGQGDFFAFDNFTIAELGQVQPPVPVPAPAPLPLVLGGLLALGFTTRRASRKASMPTR